MKKNITIKMLTVINSHRSDYPSPLTLKKGEMVVLDKVYEGAEDWPNWIFCKKLDGSNEGWVPEQLIERRENHGLVLEDYSANELNVDVGETLEAIKEMNGWVWCKKVKCDEMGWVPLKNVRKDN